MMTNQISCELVDGCFMSSDSEQLNQFSNSENMELFL